MGAVGIHRRHLDVKSLSCVVVRMLQAYWFYRPSEVPEGAWRKHRKLEQYTEGSALFKLPDSKKMQTEKRSERQVSMQGCT